MIQIKSLVDLLIVLDSLYNVLMNSSDSTVLVDKCVGLLRRIQVQLNSMSDVEYKHMQDISKFNEKNTSTADALQETINQSREELSATLDRNLERLRNKYYRTMPGA